MLSIFLLLAFLLQHQSVSSASAGEKTVSLDASSSSQSVTRRSDVSTGSEASISLKHQEAHLGGDLQSFGQSWLKSSAPFKPNSEKLASPSSIADRTKENKEESTSYSMERFSKDSLDVSSRSNSVPALGQDTLEEIADKEKFFRDLETGKQSPVDYAALNDQLTLTGTVVSFKLPDVDQDESDDDDEESMTPSTVGSTSDVSSNESKQLVGEEAGGFSESVASNSGQSSLRSSQGTPSASEKEELSDKSQSSSTISSSSSLKNSVTVNPVEKQPTDTSSPQQEGTLVSQRESISHKSSRSTMESSLSSSSTISQENGNFEESQQDKRLSLSKSLDPDEDARGFNLSPIQTSATKVVSESSTNPLGDHPPQTSVLPKDIGISEGVSLLKLNDGVRPVGPPVPGNTGPKSLQQPTVLNTSTSVVAKERSVDPSTEVKQPSHVRVSSPSFLFHSNGTLEASLKEVYAEKHSIDKDIEDVQAALEAAGLSGLGEYPKSTAHTEEDIDIQSLLREITKEEVISKSKQILHQRRGKTGPKSTIPGSPLPRTSILDSHKPVGSTSPKPGSSKISPAVASSQLPVRARKSVDSTTRGKATLVLSAVPPGEEVEDSGPVEEKDSSSVGRELKLLEEVSRWREACEEEKNDKRELETKWIAREKEILQREEMLKLQHQKELQEMKSEVFTLSAKLRERDVQSDTRRLAVGDSVDSIPVEERDRLQKELKEQEKLLDGYQRENEKVCRELSKVQKEFKTFKKTLSEENQILRTELANERAKQELKVTSRPSTNSATVPPPDHGRIAVLEDELEHAHYEEKKLVSKVTQLEQMVSVYEADMRSVTNERDGLKKNMTSLVAADTVEELKLRHQVEIQSLQEKLKWYGENQALLDRDAAILRQKEEQIRELSLKLERLEEDSRNQKKLVKERATDARRIRDLERQIKEMETIIRRRFPNSITAMIYATSQEEDAQDQKKAHDSPHTSLYLERKVRALEKELEEKDEEHSRRIRALQQQYTALETSYEVEMKKLKDKLVDFQNLKAASRKETQPHSTVNSLQKELERKKVVYQAKISELQQEVARLKKGGKKLADLTNKETEQERGVSPQKGLVHGGGTTIDALQKELASRKREYQKIRKERDSLWEQVEQFQKQQLQQQQKQSEECLQHSDRMIEKHSFDRKQADIVVQENKALKEQLSQLQLTAAQERIHLQSQLAQTEAKGRQVREDLEDKIRRLEKNHRDQVNQLVAKHAQEHSNSIVVKMKAQLANQKVQIEHLKEQVESCRFDSEALISCKLREKGLEEKLKAMALDLIEAKRYHSPEMHHYTVILGKITSLENKLNLLQEKREASLQQLSLPSQQALLDVEKKWRMRLLEKDAEIENFRSQIDEILETLSALKPYLPTHS